MKYNSETVYIRVERERERENLLKLILLRIKEPLPIFFIEYP